MWTRLTNTALMLAMALALAVPAAAQVAEDPAAPADQYEPALKTTEPPRVLAVEPLISESLGTGLDSPQVLLAPSAAALSSAIGVEIPDSGEGTYLAAFWGYKPTPGYFITIESARPEGDTVTVGLTLDDPGSNLQAVTYPYAVAVVRAPGLLEKDFSFVDQYGQELDWPVYRVIG